MRVIGVTTAALVALFAWYVLRDRSSHATTATATRGSTASVAQRSHAPPPALPDHDDDDPAPVVAETHTAMQALGRRCFVTRTPRAIASNQPDDSVGRLELRLRVHIAGGIAHVESADVVSERRLREDLRDCIVAQSRTTSWRVAAPDGVHDIVELFRMGDFVEIPRPDSPPSALPTR